MKNPGTVWDAKDGSEGPAPTITNDTIGDGRDIALAVGLARDPIQQVREYVARELPDVGTIMHVVAGNGADQVGIRGGEHAAAIATAVTAAVREVRRPGGTVHVFVSGPNAFSFLLGQQAESMGSCIPYEFDFSGYVDGSYQPTFSI